MSNWIHTINPFDVATKDSRRKMLILITDHTSRLQGGSALAIINTLHVRTLPVKTDFSAKYSAWSVANGQWRAETARVNAALKDLSGTKIENWDIRIQVIFAQDTPEYISVLPNRRVPFQEGAMDERIAAVNTLGLALDAYAAPPALVTIKDEVNAFYTQLLEKRNVQQQKEELVKNASDALEAAREVCAEMMFRNLGMLIDTYPKEPGMITNYYQMNLIQDGSDNSAEYNGTLAPSEQKNAVSSGITSNSSVFVKNDGPVPIQVDLQDNPNTIGPTAVTLMPGEEKLSSEGELPPLSAYYINVRNTSPMTEGSYHIIVS